VIRIVTLEPFDGGDISLLGKTLYQSFGVGTEFVGENALPAAATLDDGRCDAAQLVKLAPAPRALTDDKILFLTSADLCMRAGPLGEPPAWGYAEYGAGRAVVSTKRMAARGVTEASIDAWRQRLARESIHFIGHLWDLHHCYDARCAMHPSWSPSLPAQPEADLCNFCREKSERKIRLAKT
jgi:predicted Zn-dependent protease